MDIVLVHSSDLHVDDEQNATKHGDGTDGLAAVLAAASDAGADIVLLAGDTFDNNRVPAPVLDRTGRLLADAGIQVVILPGNHDPALPNSVFVRGGLASIPNVTVLGITHDEAVGFGDHDLEIWGHAHRDYENMAPLRGPRARSTRWQIAMAHGHYEPPHNLANRCARPGCSATMRSPRPRPTTSHSATGTARRASGMARCRPTTPARRTWRGRST